MRKLFTLAATLLASLTMMAQTITLSAVTPESNWYGAEGVGRVTNKSGNAWSSPDMTCDGSTGYKTGSSYFTIQTYQDISALTIWARSTSNRTIGKIYVSEDLKSSAQSASNVEYTVTNENSTDYAVAKNACDNEFTLTFKDVVEANNYIQIVLSGNADIVAVTFVAGSVTPSTDPVTTVTVSGPTSAYVDRELTFTATTDVKADTLYWTVDGTVVEGEHSKTLKFTPTAERTYQIGAWAKNSNNSDWVTGNISVVATVKPVLAQVSVDASTVWDFTKAASVNEIKWTGDQKDAEPVLLANVDDFNNDANFNSQALLFSGEYPIRDGKYCQGPHLAFTTTVPGSVVVEFSNTGSKDDPRYVAINDVVNTEVGSKTSEKVVSATIPVEAGNVVINGAFADGTHQYLRIYKVTFQQTGWPTAIDNTNDEVKAVKIIRDGQLFIQKNGVLYNAQGAVVK
jgi:hypothetical protein